MVTGDVWNTPACTCLQAACNETRSVNLYSSQDPGERQKSVNNRYIMFWGILDDAKAHYTQVKL